MSVDNEVIMNTQQQIDKMVEDVMSTDMTDSDKQEVIEIETILINGGTTHDVEDWQISKSGGLLPGMIPLSLFNEMIG